MVLDSIKWGKRVQFKERVRGVLTAEERLKATNADGLLNNTRKILMGVWMVMEGNTDITKSCSTSLVLLSFCFGR